MIDLELCNRFWHRIYHIQRRDVYSFYEIERLVKDIEKIKENCPEPDRLLWVLDECYKHMDSSLQKRMELISHLRTIFHRPLRELGENPYTNKRKVKLKKNMFISKQN